MIPSSQQLAEIFATWLLVKELEGVDLSGFDVRKDRIEYVFQTALEEKNTHYFSCKPSPLKIAACFSFAIAKERPIYCFSLVNAAPDQKRDLLEKEQRLNGELAWATALWLVNISSFKHCEKISPPYNLTYPSKHIRGELFYRLSCGDKINTIGIAFVLELLLYMTEKGKLICGSCDDKA